MKKIKKILCLLIFCIIIVATNICNGAELEKQPQDTQDLIIAIYNYKQDDATLNQLMR